MENISGMRLQDGFAFSLRTLPPGRAIVLTALATLLAAADWLPENRVVDPDLLEFLLTLAIGASAIVVALRDRADAVDLVRWRNRAILLSITMAIMAIGAEFATRWIFRNVTTSADNGGYFSRRWLQSGAIHLNSAGFRGPQFSADKPAGIYRIAAVGDSFTFGNGVRQEDRYSDLLQARLPAHFEVLNFGQPGANTPEHYHHVLSILENAHPDFILLQWYVNDMEDDDTTGRPTFKPLMPIPAIHRWLGNDSALYNVANMQWAETQVALGMTTSYTEYLHQRLGDANGTDATIDRRFLLELIDRCKKAGVPLGIVLFPDTALPIDDGYPFGYLHDRVLGMCADAGLTCLDLRNDFAQVKDHRELWANRLDHHPSAKANAIAALRILETYSGMWAGKK